ncbi:MAG TPA: TauD/TfdA family dioxygenase [Steroidobacteraceae bacterium]|nr:TauD/TfdA family dioxygenase [Steroidobacteraceae bacterium]
MSAQAVSSAVFVTPDTLTVEWADGSLGEFASVWLRDNLPQDRDPTSGQRLVDIADLPELPRIRSAVARGGTIRVEWEGESTPALFDLNWLAAQSRTARDQRPELARRFWLEGARLEASRDFAWASIEDVSEDRARLVWLMRLLQEGVAFLRDVPSTEGALLEAMRWVGRVAETNYGPVFDVRSVPQPENLAYSDYGLGLHTDNPYREPVPGFQALHVLIASPEGGDSLFADGFALAEHLRAEDPSSFALLTQIAVPFHYASHNADLYAQRPLIELSCGGEVVAVHYNSRSIAPLRLRAQDARAFYGAYRRFATLLHDRRFQMRLRLAAGNLVVFDNQRILHGRTAFSSARHPRHLRGCYLTRDSLYSAAALLRRELDRRSLDPHRGHP